MYSGHAHINLNYKILKGFTDFTVPTMDGIHTFLVSGFTEALFHKIRIREVWCFGTLISMASLITGVNLEL